MNPLRLFSRVARFFWRLLPVGWRHHLFALATTAIAPRSSGGAQRVPVIVAGTLSSATGLGESARLNIAVLRKAGLAHGAVDLSGSLLGHADLARFPTNADESVVGPGSLVVHVSGLMLPYALRRCQSRIVAGKRVIGYLAWELPRLPADWLPALRLLHEIWVPSEFSAGAMRRKFAGPVRVLPHLIDVDGVRRNRRHDVFTVFTMFNVASGFERKNPLAAIRAFKVAFGGDQGTRLVIKIHNADHYPSGHAALHREIGGAANIVLLDRVMPRRDLLETMAEADAVISLHRSEGFGLLLAEAMMIGVPVVSTDWSATAEFVTPDTGVPVPFRLIPAIDPQGACHYPDQMWADADIDAAAAGLRALRQQPDWAGELAERGRLSVTRMFSAEAAVRRLRDALS
jgi:glycosyltransferase involved in cell wall biosynthesis